MLLSAALMALLPCAAYGTVSLTLTDTVGSPNSVSLLPGQSFTVALKMVSTSEQTLGLDYLLEPLGIQGSGLFRVTAEDLTGSFFPQVYHPFSEWSTPPLNVLDPHIGATGSDVDLGGIVANVGTPTSGAGTFQVANFTFLVDPTTAPATYVIQSGTIIPGKGWIDTGVNDHEIPSNLQASYSVIVTPEPSMLGLVGLGLIILRKRPRR
jgi:hypothetical protein